jgi:hypothetical protein
MILVGRNLAAAEGLEPLAEIHRWFPNFRPRAVALVRVFKI